MTVHRVMSLIGRGSVRSNMGPIALFHSCLSTHSPPFNKLHAFIFYYSISPTCPFLDRFLTRLEIRLLFVSIGLLSMKVSSAISVRTFLLSVGTPCRTNVLRMSSPSWETRIRFARRLRERQDCEANGRDCRAGGKTHSGTEHRHRAHFGEYGCVPLVKLVTHFLVEGVLCQFTGIGLAMACAVKVGNIC
jgi:hypothetical protein